MAFIACSVDSKPVTQVIKDKTNIYSCYIHMYYKNIFFEPSQMSSPMLVPRLVMLITASVCCTMGTFFGPWPSSLPVLVPRSIMQFTCMIGAFCGPLGLSTTCAFTEISHACHWVILGDQQVPAHVISWWLCTCPHQSNPILLHLCMECPWYLPLMSRVKVAT
jgi:hypothetical protein